ncbi:hypothetical protein [Klebsiella variicola]|uniref:hypothetical protein n=1 Tax=Klebsiella pneumoniae complex TaxID=3390273 RepID=UPI00069021B1|nr:hypothetical protein KR75_27665 [Klebsiella variicola]HCB2374845.1 hypothetical protein [Klebsiella pneumoniae]
MSIISVDAKELGRELASIRSMYYISGSLGAGEIKALIQEWWRNTYELHKVPAPSYTAVPITFSFH